MRMPMAGIPHQHLALPFLRLVRGDLRHRLDARSVETGGDVVCARGHPSALGGPGDVVRIFWRGLGSDGDDNSGEVRDNGRVDVGEGRIDRG